MFLMLGALYITTMKLQKLVITMVLVATVSTGAAVASDTGGEIKELLEDEETIEKGIEQYNEQVVSYSGPGADLVRQQLGNEVVNVEIRSNDSANYKYSAKVNDELQISEFNTSHREDATVRAETSIETIRTIGHAEDPVGAAREAWRNDQITVTATEDAGMVDRVAFRAVDIVSDSPIPAGEDTQESVRETIEDSVDTVENVADRLGI